jgi:hypothetical protein
VASIPSVGMLTEAGREALLDLLSDRTTRRYRDWAVLTVVPALEELIASLVDAQSGRAPLLEGDRGSLVADLDLALTRAGSRLVASTTPSLAELRTREVAELATTLADPAECQRVVRVAEDVLAQLRADSALEAAWSDLIEALDDGAATTDRCALRGDQLAELVRLRGNDATFLVSRLADTVRDGDLEAAGRQLLELAEDATVVWLAFGNADLDRGYCKVGQIQFITHRLDLEHIRDGCPALNAPEFEPASELTEDALAMFPDVKDEEHFVRVRVELTGPRAYQPRHGRGLPPIEWAREYVRGVVEAAAFPAGGTEWELLDGGYVFTASGGHGGSAWFRAPDRERERFFGSPFDEPTSEHLGALPDTFADALARDDTSARFAADEVRWHRTAELGGDVAVRVALFVRGFERQWATGAADRFRTWEEPARRFLRDAWANTALGRYIQRAGLTIHTAAHGPDGTEDLRLAAEDIHSWTGGVGFQILLPAVMEHAPKVANDFPAGSLDRRQLKEVARRTRDGDRIREWWREEMRRFDTLLNRAVRQRNGVIHGRMVIDAVAASVEPFLRRLSAWLVSESVRGAIEGRPVDEVLDELRTSNQARYEKLEGEPSGAFFGD